MTKYPNARRIWLKGIWNISYNIPDEDNEDRYPLIIPHISSKEKAFVPRYVLKLEKIINFFSILKQLL